jgi:protocatechuate 4,5-dioxygenase, beta chain
MARITASVYTSHVPAIGAALDLGKAQEDYWKPVFAGYDFSKQWMKDTRPDVIFLVYNDHATAFSLDMIPTFAIGTAASWPRTSRTRSSSKTLTSPSSTKWTWTTA